MDGMNRRDFLKNTARTMVAFSAGAALMAAKKTPKRVDKANDRIVMGAIGLGGRGRDHARSFARRDDVELAYVCDVDENERIGSFPKQIEGVQKRLPAAVTDMRRIFDDKNVDAVVIATCDHWHALAAIWACQAGKDVYVEKPASNNVWEGRKMVEAARKYDRVVQVGTQNRSAPYIREAAEYIQNGKLGDVPLVKVYNMKAGLPFKCPPDTETPKGVDYDKYLGPAPARPFNRAHFHDGWKMFWAYSGGDMGDDGSHQLDIARLLIGDPAYPAAVNASGGRLAFQDDREVPDTQVVTYEYRRQIMTFELAEYTPYMLKTSGEIRDKDLLPFWPTNATRIELYGTKGMMYVGRHGGGWQVIVGDGKEIARGYGRQTSEEHRANFLDCVRNRQRPNADIEIGHLSTTLVHLGNLGTRLGGRRFVYDGASESIPGDAEAQALLTRDYRAPYVVPEKI